MAKTKRTPSNTVGALVGAMQAALAADIEPPDHVRLRPGDQPFWIAIVRARARAEWSTSDLVHAGNLARCMADIERISREMEGEGDVIENARGTLVMNPKHQVLEMLSRRSMAITRLMQMQAAASGDADKKTKARAQESSARQSAAEIMAEDDLIPAG